MGLGEYNIFLKGRVHIPTLCQIIESDLKIILQEKSDYGYKYKFETKEGRIDIYISIGEFELRRKAFLEAGKTGRDDIGKRAEAIYNSMVDRNYTDTIDLSLFIATPPQVIEDLLKLFQALPGGITFSIQVQTFIRESRSLKSVSPNPSEVKDYQELITEYSKTQEEWRIQGGILGFLCEEDTQEALGVPAFGLDEFVKYGLYALPFSWSGNYLPLCVFLCPQDVEVNAIVTSTGALNFTIEGKHHPDTELDFYERVKAIEFESCRLQEIQPDKELVIFVSEKTRIPLKILRSSPEKGHHYAVITSMGDVKKTSTVSWGKYIEDILQLASHTKAEGPIEEIVQCLVEIATKLNWYIVEGFYLQKAPPTDLEKELLNLIQAIKGGKANNS